MATRIKTYYQLAKPGIVYGNSLAVVAGYFLAAATYGFDIVVFAAVMVATALIMGGACVFNNITDSSIDKFMKRTQKRALVTGAVSTKTALWYGVALLTIGFALLAYFTNSVTVLIGAIGVLDYVVLYAYAKRHSVYGTVVGTIAGAVPPIAGYTALSGHVDLAALLLFIILFFWQMAHFYAIALFRKGDYARVHIPVYPVIKGVAATKRWMVVYIIGFVIATLALAVCNYVGTIYAIVMSIVGGYWLYVAVKNYRLKDDDKWARSVFKSSLLVLLAFCFMTAIGAYLP